MCILKTNRKIINNWILNLSHHSQHISTSKLCKKHRHKHMFLFVLTSTVDSSSGKIPTYLNIHRLTDLQVRRKNTSWQQYLFKSK